MDSLVVYNHPENRLTPDGAVQELLRQIDRFEVAFNNVTHGVCFFDGNRQLILANRRYAEIYRLDPTGVVPGTALDDIVDMRYAAGTGPDMTRDEYLTWRASIAVSDRPSDTLVELKSGQTIFIHHRPMPDGGWVATHEDISERRRTETRLAYMARHDPLTGLMNRLALPSYIEQQAARSEQSACMAILCLDLDNFKQVNDLYGHATGDALLCAAAKTIRDNIRDDDIAVRLGGDEFAIVQTRNRQPKAAISLARRLIAVLSRSFDIGAHSIAVGVSVGIAYAPVLDTDPETILRNADIALYRAKADGKGTYRLFNSRMSAELQRRYATELELRRAVTNGEMELFFQPILDARSQTIKRFEALVRWKHPQREHVPPAEFIPLAEETGVIIPLGKWVLCEACRIAVAWPNKIGVCVNLSPVQFKDPNLPAMVDQALAQSGLAPQRLELEITETALLRDTTEVLNALQKIRDMGVRISLDDFGTGYSSIGYLRRFQFDTIKIDRSFVRDLTSETHSLNIVNAIIGLGRSLGMSLTAEGVETVEQMGILCGERCPELQGYLFSAPVPLSGVPGLIERFSKNPHRNNRTRPKTPVDGGRSARSAKSDPISPASQGLRRADRRRVRKAGGDAETRVSPKQSDHASVGQRQVSGE